jgi:hypothetical protein
MDNTNRRLDLSVKFMKMGQSLILEGKEKKDISISEIGTILIFMSGLLLGDDDDIDKFSDLCSMFSAKTILESLEQQGGAYTDMIKKASETTSYDDYIKRINDLKKDEDDNNQIN